MISSRNIPIAALLLSATAFADSWAPPTSQVFGSPSGERVVRIEPASRSDVSNPQKCRALVFAFDPATKDYALIKELTLANPVTPVEAVITDDGQFLVTFDDYFSVGYGENVIVVYDLTSGSETHLKLEDFLSGAQIEAFEKSTSSRRWRGSVTVMDNQRAVYIGWAESNFDPAKVFPSFILDLEAKTASIEQRAMQDRAQQHKPDSAKAWWQFWK